MNSLYVALTVVILSNVVYHVSLKSLPHGAHAVLSAVVMYAVALAATLAAYPLVSQGAPLGEELRKMNWAPYVVGLAIVGIEIGFLLAYRAGLNVSYGSVFTHSFVAVLLVPFGILLFREKISWINIVGIVLCLIGLFLVVKKGD